MPAARPTILLFGAGKSATMLIRYLGIVAAEYSWKIFVADADEQQVLLKTRAIPAVFAIQVNVTDSDQRAALICQADLVISLLPPALHFLVARDCVATGKHLLTASYADPSMKRLEPDIRHKGLLFICELGLDPGIDHMSALQRIHAIQARGGKILSFKSHCGGLVAPESDDNPWHYKISWNPRNIVTAGKAGAIYREHGQQMQESQEQLFDSNRQVDFPGLGTLSFYPNRNSLDYSELYGLEKADTLLRTTLRHPAFMKGWQQIIRLKLTDERFFYETNGMSIQAFFHKHFSRFGFASILQHPNAQLEYLGLHDRETIIGKGRCSAADVLQFILESKLALKKENKDMVVMLHEIIYEEKRVQHVLKSSLLIKGDNAAETAMAKTVGLPLGIAAKLILTGRIQLTGLHLPVVQPLYEPILQELEKWDIYFKDSNS